MPKENCMSERIARVALLMGLIFPVLACGSIPGLARPTPTVWVAEPWISVPEEQSVMGTSLAPAPSGTAAGIGATAPTPVEIGILKCQNNPSTGVVPAQTPIVLVWGWATDNEAKRDEFLSIGTYVVRVDTLEQDMNGAQRNLEDEGTVRWNLPIGQLPAGNHEVRLTTILAKSFTESSGTYPAGQLEDIVCQLDVRP